MTRQEQTEQTELRPFHDTVGGVNLDELQSEVENLLALIRNRQPGLMSWNKFMREHLQNLHKLTAQALDK